MDLNRRQKALYKHKCDIWSVDRTVTAGTNKPSDEIYILILENVPCIYEYTPNVDVETEAGRVKEFTLLTTDKIHMEASVPVEDGYLIVNRTVKRDGKPSRATNEVHKMLGQPEIHESLGRRKANKLMMEGMSIEHPPTQLVAHYPGMNP